MTRINVIPVKELANQHLMAEWREIFHVHARLGESINSKNGLDFNKIPNKYTFGSGHIYFFYNKLSYLLDRHSEVYRELLRRNYNVQFRQYPVDNFMLIKDKLVNYKPSEEDIKVNYERVSARLAQKPDWYKFFRD